MKLPRRVVNVFVLVLLGGCLGAEPEADEPSLELDSESLLGCAAGATAVNSARNQLGKPYGFGAEGPTAFDAAGLVVYAWRTAGMTLPHSISALARVGRRIQRADLQPGDLVFYGSTHVAIYIGGGQVVGVRPGGVVKISSIASPSQPTAFVSPAC